MTQLTLPNGEVVYDPTGRVDAAERDLAPRPSSLRGLRVGVLDNSKWNAAALLRKTVEQLEESDGPFAGVTFVRKHSFSSNAAPELLQELADSSDFVLTAIGD